MKRTIASLLAAVLLMSAGLPISAFSDEGMAVSETIAGNGAIEVSLGQAIPVKGMVSFNVTLSKESGTTIGNQTIALSNGTGETSQRTAKFENLAGGRYTLTAESDGYRTFTQTVDVEEGYTYKLNVSNGFLAGYTYQKNDVHPGVQAIWMEMQRSMLWTQSCW